MSVFTLDDVEKTARLAALTLTDAEKQTFVSQFEKTLETISVINELNTKETKPTSQVTQLSNQTREDKIDLSRVLPVDEALRNAPSTYKGFIKIPRILDHES